MADAADFEKVPAPETVSSQEGDITNNEPASGDITMTKEEFDEVKQHIEKLQTEYDKTVLLAQRIQADFDNYRKRNASVRTDSCNEGIRNVIKKLLPVLDNFDRAMDSHEDTTAAWADGIRLVHRQLNETLQKVGLEEIPAEGKFAPNFHDAVLQEECECVESGCIAEVLQKGYKVNDCIIRHSMVKVAK